MMIKKTAMTLLLAAALQTSAQAEVQWIDSIVAVAGKQSITERELNSEYRLVARELRARGAAVDQNEALRKQVLERLVLKKLQLQAAERSGITVAEGELDSAIERIASENSMTLSRFKVALGNEGIDYEDFRNNIRDELTISRLRERRLKIPVTVSDQEIDDLISANGGGSNDEYHLAQILIALPEAAAPEQVEQARKQAELLRRQASEGADFSQLAVNNSGGQNALQGGDLGWRAINQLPALFGNSVRGLQPGQISQPVRSASGYHLFKVVDVRSGSQTPMVEQNHTRHILVTADGGELMLRDLKRRIEAGEDFATLARQYSQDPGSAKNGGDLGWNVPGTFVGEFEQAISKLSAGGISDPFRTQYGWHIVQLLERRTAEVPDDMLRARAREVITTQRREEDMQRWLQELRDEAYVEIRAPGMSDSN